METIFMNMQNSETNEPYEPVLTCHKDYTYAVQLNILLFKTYVFITVEKYNKAV